MVDYGNTGGRIRGLTGTQVGLAAGTQDGVKLGLVGSHFILTGGVQFLWRSTWEFNQGPIIRLYDSYNIKGN